MQITSVASESAVLQVLGYEVARFLSPFESSIGKRIKIGPDYFECVGVLLPRVPLSSDAPAPGLEVTGEVFVPLTTGRRWFGGHWEVENGRQVWRSGGWREEREERREERRDARFERKMEREERKQDRREERERRHEERHRH